MQNTPPPFQNTPFIDILRRVRNAPVNPSSFANLNWLNTPFSIRLTVRRWVIVVFVILIVFMSGIFFGRSLSVSGNQSQVTHADNNNQPNTNSPQNIVTPTPTDTPLPTQTPTENSYPNLASSYQGTVHNTTYGGTATLSLTSIVQNQGEISGNVVIGSGLCGSGSFTGTIESDGSVNFTDNPTDNCAMIDFSGLLNVDGSFGGTYNLPSWNQEGTWQTTPN
jgi:hypothetical protein